MSWAGCASSGAPPVTTVRRSMPACAGCCGVAVAGSSDARGKALPVLWFGGGTASTAAARAAVRGWLHKQNQTLSQISAREMTRPRTPNLLHCIIGLSYTCTCVAVLQLRAHTVTLLYLYWSHLLQFRVFIHLGCCCKQCCS
jgi:hypothetical protein